MASAAEQAALEFEVVALLPGRDAGVGERLAKTGVPVTSLGLRTRWDPRALGGVASVLRSRAPDVIHTHLKHADIAGAFASRRTGIPMVSTLHVVEDAAQGLQRAKRGLGAWARGKQATVTIAVSDAQRRWYVDQLGGDPESVVTVRNGVADHPAVGELGRQALRVALGVRPGEILATTVAIMRPGKGHGDVLALAEAMGPDAGVRFVLVGDGELRDDLERRAAANAARSAPVVFAGFRDDVPALLQASDLALHPSHADALPTALIHALAAGRPTVAYAVGGVPEIVTPATGILVAPFDVSGLGKALRRLQVSADLREELGRGARERFEAEFTVAAWMQRLRVVYERTIRLGSRHRSAKARSR